MTWFVAVTTAPRKGCTLHQCLSSLQETGWKPHVFAEPGSTPTPSFPTITNKRKRGLWHNWIYSAQYALRFSDAENILTVQDDALLHPESKEFIEKRLWPSPSTGLISLYTPKHYGFDKNGVPRPLGLNRIQEPTLWGAVALVWPREVLKRVLQTKVVKYWIGVPPSRGTKESLEERQADPSLVKNSDAAIGLALNEIQRSTYYVKPSLVIHASTHSTVGNGSNVGQRNCWNPADHNKPLSLPPGNPVSLNFPEDPQIRPELTEQHLQQISRVLREGGKVLQLGSGESTQQLIEAGYQVVSIEEKTTRMGQARGAAYIHAPLVNGWYDFDSIIRTKRVWNGYSLLLIDGPRAGEKKIPSWLLQGSPVLINNTHQPEERKLAESLSKSHRAYTTVCRKEKRWFTLLLPNL